MNWQIKTLEEWMRLGYVYESSGYILWDYSNHPLDYLTSKPIGAI